MVAATRSCIKAIAALAAAASVLAVAWPRAARAGRTHFGWVRATEVVPQRTVELETWILEKNGVADGDDGANGEQTRDETAVWWTTIVGITDQVELSVPVQLRHFEVGDAEGQTLFYGFGAELRWRLVSSDPVEAGPVAPTLRAGVHRLVNQRSRTSADGGVALGLELGRVHAALDVGATWTTGGDEDSIVELTPAAGISVRVFGDLRMGAEAYGEATFGGPGADWVAVGPNMAWTHGRFWISAALPIGLVDVSTAPRINWAVAF